MKKFMNSAAGMLAESLSGFARCHRDIVALDEGYRFVRRRQIKPGKVALISGGGSGHEPLHAGFVGEGMLDAACPGQVFTSPTPDQITAAAEAVDAGAGLLFIVKNYAGDVMNFALAAEICGANAETLIVGHPGRQPHESGAAGGDQRRHSRRGARDDREPRLRLGRSGDRHGDAGDLGSVIADVASRRRHGEHGSRAVPAAQRALGPAHRRHGNLRQHVARRASTMPSRASTRVGIPRISWSATGSRATIRTAGRNARRNASPRRRRRDASRQRSWVSR